MIVIAHHGDGTATCLHTDAIPLAELGQLQVRRASTIEFNAHSQQWEVRLEADPCRVMFADPSRERCLAWERDYFNERLSTFPN